MLSGESPVGIKKGPSFEYDRKKEIEQIESTERIALWLFGIFSLSLLNTEK